MAIASEHLPMAFAWVLSRHSGAGLRRQAALHVKIPIQLKSLTSKIQLNCFVYLASL